MIERSFKVCRYECDLYGHLNNANYLRYIDAVDEDLAGPCGPAVRMRIEFVRALKAGDTVRVVSETPEPQNGWQQRQYLFRCEQNDVARAEVDFVALEGRDLGDPIAASAPQPAGTFRLQRHVQWRDLDMTGCVEAGGLASLAEDGAVHVSVAHGWPLTRCADEGFAIVLRRHEIELGVPLGLGDEVEIETWASNPRRSTAIRHYLLRRMSDNAQVARFRSLYVWINLATGRPIRIPKDFLEAFAANFSEV